MAVQLKEAHNISSLISKIDEKLQKLFKEKEYLTIINLFPKYLQIADEYIVAFYFNSIINWFLYAGISYFELDMYNDALRIFNQANKLKDVVFSKIKSFETHNDPDFIEYLNKVLDDFNKNHATYFYLNYAYVCYKNKEYNQAIKYYNKLGENTGEKIQVIVGKAQCMYALKGDKATREKNKKIYIDYINILMKKAMTFDVLLAIGKLYFFAEKYDHALFWVQKAIERLNNSDTNKKIHAYDWLSRIAYKQEQYAAASAFYEKIIDLLIQNPNTQQHEVIHPTPQLHKMVKFYNETKALLHKEELKLVNKTIWIGVLGTAIFGLNQIYEPEQIITTILIILLVIYAVWDLWLNKLVAKLEAKTKEL